MSHHEHHKSEAIPSVPPTIETAQHYGHENLHVMKTTFHFDQQVQLLFEKFNLTEDNHVIAACIVLAIIAFMNEAVKLGRAKIQVKMKPKQFLNITCAQKLFNGWHFLQTFLHLLQMVISYTLMLAFMTFQAWICISILIGSTVGYFLLGWAHTSFNSDCG